MANILNPRDVPNSHLPHLKTYDPTEPYEMARRKFDDISMMVYDSQLRMSDRGPSWAIPGPLGSWMAACITCKVHPYAKPVFSCAHCMEQDPVHPDGIILSDKGWYVCRTCWNRITSSKWRYWEQLQGNCHHCVKAMVEKLIAKDPTKFVNYLDAPKIG